MSVRKALRSSGADAAIYPWEERVGEESLQRFILELLRPLVERWLAERGIRAFTGADQFIYYRKGDATERVAPDLYVLPGVRPGRRIKSWKVWQEGVAPTFALEVVSGEVDKDYIEAPARYREIGVRELILFDPDHEEDSGRYRFQVFRQVGKRGLTRVLVTDEDRVLSKVLGCHVLVVGVGEAARLRLATGAHGERLFPLEAEVERAEKERERAEKERERAGRLAAEAEIDRLRKLLGVSTRRARRTPKRKK